MARLSILVVGDLRRTEFRQPAASLHAADRVLWAADEHAAAALLSQGGVTVDLIVVAQAYPGQFSPQAIQRLQTAAPLARVVGLLGSWCEGETRSGRPWPGAARLYWHQWTAQSHRELALLRAGRSGTWALPPTATQEERLLASRAASGPPRKGLVAIWSRQFDMQHWLSAACLRRGYSTVWLRPGRTIQVEGVHAGIFDSGELSRQELESLRQMKAAVAPAPVVALLDFPRVEDQRRVLQAGAVAVVSKPLLVEDLFWQIDWATGCLQEEQRP